jgi:hypothetical protein
MNNSRDCRDFFRRHFESGFYVILFCSSLSKHKSFFFFFRFLPFDILNQLEFRKASEPHGYTNFLKLRIFPFFPSIRKHTYSFSWDWVWDWRLEWSKFWRLFSVILCILGKEKIHIGKNALSVCLSVWLSTHSCQ